MKLVDTEKEKLLKELIYRSCHRGCKETDLLLGSFAKANVDKMSVSELHSYKLIIEQDDLDIYNWLTDKEIPPSHLNRPLLNKIKTHYAKATT